jgi:L-ribulose-5-phosphate 4-epimerase
MFNKLKKECFDANMLLPQLGLVIYTFGNVSCIDRNLGVFAIKPSGVDYLNMGYDDMVIVDLDGKTVEGKLRPSSDTNTHCVLYKSFGNIGGIVHTHSTFATAWAQSLRSIPLYGTTHADHLATDIPCTGLMEDAKICNDYETETGNQIIDCFRNKSLNPAETKMVLVAGHGPFAWGEDAGKAVYNAKVLEELARMALLTEQINPASVRLKDELVAKHYERKHGKNAYYGQK